MACEPRSNLGTRRAAFGAFSSMGFVSVIIVRELFARWRPAPHLDRVSNHITRLTAASKGRYHVEREFRERKMDTEYLAIGGREWVKKHP